MNTDSLLLLFTIEIEIPEEYRLAPNLIDHKKLKQLEKILSDIYDGFRLSILEDEKVFPHPVSSFIGFHEDSFISGSLKASIFINQYSDDLADHSNLTSSLSEFLATAIDMFVIERHSSIRKYVISPSDRPSLTVTGDNQELEIGVSHPIISKIANRLQGPLATLYSLNENMFITVCMGDECIEIPGFPDTIQHTLKHRTTQPEQHIAILHNDNQSQNKYRFLISLGSSKPRRLTKVDQASSDELTKIQNKAMNERPVSIEIYRLDKTLRGISTAVNDVEFVRILTDFDRKQIPLIPVDIDSSDTGQ